MKENLEPSVPYAPFFIGRAIHFCIEKYYSEQVPFWDSLDAYLENEEKIAGNLWKAEKDKWDESVDLISELIMHYSQWIQVDTSEYRDDTLEFADMEIPFNVPMFNPETGLESEEFRLEGRFDGLVLHKPTNKWWIWEAKTARSIAELTRSLENDEQAGAYMYAAQQWKEIKVEGMLYNIIRKKAPTHPRILDSGFLSKQKGDYTAFSYVADIKKHHGDADWPFIEQNYGDVIYPMSVGNNGFFVRFPVRRSAYEVDMLMKNLYYTAVEMTDPKTVLYPAPNFVQCNMCAFRTPCIAMSRGSDYQSLLDAEFQKRTKAESFREVEI